ncbi:hypothetical protein Pmani_020688 [Petrolisthes manimaculis]|uniref:Mitotic spindle assembly checkpoint protein MAD1 n=1 Tax=Petrolisthes manimaculis TaxID=1843537 RepID=A0AAE1PH49_9EUCA|nr:hypothetical protein Pmani_020688 [Petrolisthes manimaculis]
MSPEPTVVVRALKDFDQFVKSGSKGRSEMFKDSAKQLNFSTGEDSRFLATTTGSHQHMAIRTGAKRRLDSLVGFDVTKKFREKESEVVSAQADVVKLGRLMQEAEDRYKKALLEKDVEIETLRTKQRRDKELVDDLQHKLKRSLSRAKESEETMERVCVKSSTSTLDTEAKMIQMQSDHLNMCNKLHQDLENLRTRVLTLEREAEEKDAKVTLAESHLEEVEEELTEVRKKAMEANSNQHQADILQIQLDQSRAKIKELEARLEKVNEAEQKVSLFESAIKKLPPLERELAKMKQDNKFLKATALNNNLLEEKLGQAQQEIKQLKQRCQKNAELEAQLDTCKAKLVRFEVLGKEELELQRAATPEDLRFYMAKLRKGDQAISDNIQELRANLQSHRGSREASENEVNRLRQKLEQEQRSTQQNAHLVKRLQRKLILVTKERDGLRNVLTSYESEVTINHSAVSQERTRRLEEQLTLYQQELKRLEDDLEAAERGTPRMTKHTQPKRSEELEKVKQLEKRLQEREDQVRVVEEKEKEREKKIKELEKRVEEMEVKIKELEREKEVYELRLENRALKGDYDPTKTKVLHFKDNPLARAREGRKTELERMKEANSELRERIKLLEAGETHNLTQQVDMNLAQSSQPNKHIIELQEKVKSLESRNKRMMEAFKSRAMEMREVVYRLTGYRVDTYGDNHYKLIPMYVESSDDYLLFEKTPNHELRLLETDFSASLEYLIDAYLTHEKSYPAFLSALTIELFNRQAGFQQASSPSQEEEEEIDEEEEEEDARGEEEVVVMSDEDSDEVQEDENDNSDDLVILD